MKSVIENIRRIRNLMILEDKFTTDIDLAMHGDSQEPIQKGPDTNDGDNEAPDGMDESELSEDDAAPAGDSGGASASYPTLNKWASGSLVIKKIKVVNEFGLQVDNSDLQVIIIKLSN